MSDRFFLDTNIFVYSFDNTAPKKADRAAELIRRAIETQEGIVSYQVLQEFLNVDVWNFDALGRVVSFMGLGAALLTVSFLYAKHREILRRVL